MKKVVCTIFILVFLSVLSGYSEEQPGIKEVEVKEFGGYWYVYMDVNGPYTQIPGKIETFVKEFKKQGLKADGGVIFITFYNPPSVYSGNDLRWAVSTRVKKDVEPKEPIKKRFLTPIKSVIIMHTLPRKRIKESFAKVEAYFKDNKLEKAWPAYEIYHADGIEVIHPVKY